MRFLFALKFMLGFCLVAGGAQASPMSLDDALRMAQGLAVEADWISSHRPAGPSVTYRYDQRTRSAQNWTGRLTGGLFDLSYTGDLSDLATGRIGWRTFGEIDGAGYDATSSLMLDPIAGGFNWTLRAEALLNGISRVFTMSGRAIDTVDGYEIPYTDSGRLSLDGIFLVTTYSIWSRPGTYTMFDDENGIYNTYWNAEQDPRTGLLSATFVAPIPEPSTIGLVLAAAAGGVLARWARERRTRYDGLRRAG